MLIKRRLVLFVMISALCGLMIPVAAQQDPVAQPKPPITTEKRALIAELLEVTESKKVGVQLYQSFLDEHEKQTPDLLWQGMLARKEFQELTNEEREKAKREFFENSQRSSKRVRDLMNERMDFSAMIEDITYELYDKYFTDEDLKTLVAFYRTSTGKKSVEVGPKLFNESVIMTMERMKPKMLEIMAILQKEEEERISKQLKILKSSKPAPSKPPRRKGKPVGSKRT